MNVGQHEVPERLVYQSVPLEGARPLKALRDDSHAEMTFAFPRAGVTDVEVAVVADLERFGREGLLEPRAYLLDPTRRHG